MRNRLLMGIAAILVDALHCLGAEPLRVEIDVSSADKGKIIANKFGDINMWMVENTWLKTADTYPADYFKTRFPFVGRIQLMAATGGNPARDLFKNPEDRTTTADTDVHTLVKACEAILAKGLKPMIKTGWVPLKLSAEPCMGKAFKTNLRPPQDYDAYYTYILTIAEGLKARFGTAEMKTWSWGVGVEYENKDWFEAADAAFWKSREADYGRAGEMKPEEEQRAVNPDGTLPLPTRLPPEAVVLYEIFPVSAEAEKAAPGK